MPAKVGERIKSARMDNRMSQADLSLKLDVSQSAVAHWERAKNVPSLVQLQDIAKELAVDSNWLAFGLSDKRKKVEVIGIVSEGRIVNTIQSGQRFVEMPPIGNNDQLVQAIIVTDNSFYPLYRCCDVIFVSQAAERLVDIVENQNECFIETECGYKTIGRLSVSTAPNFYNITPVCGPPSMGLRIRLAKVVLWCKKNTNNTQCVEGSEHFAFDS